MCPQLQSKNDHKAPAHMRAGPCIPASGEGAPPNRELTPAPWILPTPSSHSQHPQFCSSSRPTASPIPRGHSLMSSYSGPPVSPGHPFSDPQALLSLASPDLTPRALCTGLPPPVPLPGTLHPAQGLSAHAAPSPCTSQHLLATGQSSRAPVLTATFLFFRALGSTQPPRSPVIHREGEQDF